CDGGGGRGAGACGTATACAAWTRWTSCQEDLPEMVRIEPHSLPSVARPPSTSRLTETKSPVESRELKERECPNSGQYNVDHFSERSVSASSFSTAVSAPACSNWNPPHPISGARHWWAGWTAWCCTPRVEAVHPSFPDVGCDVVEPGRFQATRLRLAEWGQAERTLELNRAGAAL